MKKTKLKFFAKVFTVILFFVFVTLCLHKYGTLSKNDNLNNETNKIESIREEQTIQQKAKPNIIFNTIPKSGSVYITTVLKDGLNYDYMQISPSYFPHDNISCEQIDKFYSSNSQITQEHLDASIFNIQLLKKHTNKIIVHLRDPRQVLLSWVHQLDLHKKNGKDILLYYIAPTPPEEYYNWSLERKIDWNIDNFLPNVVTWIDDWLKFKDQQDSIENGFEVLLTTYDDFIDDEIKFYSKILQFYEISSNDFNFNPPTKDLTVHFRKGDTQEWKKVFTVAQKNRISQIIPENLMKRFNWERERE